MTLALAQDKLGYGPEQMAALSQQIRLGDLTPVMQLYEDDIKKSSALRCSRDPASDALRPSPESQGTSPQLTCCDSAAN